MNNSKGLIFATMGINMVLGIADRVAQICYVAMTSFLTPTIKKTAITFCVLPTAIHLFMILIYVIFHNEEMHNTRFKIKIFFMYLFSTETLFPIGVHRSFKSKFSDNSDSIMQTLKIINAVHVMFVSLPQLLIISVHSSALEHFKGIDITSLILSIIFMVYSIGYYFICTTKEDDFENTYEDYVN